MESDELRQQTASERLSLDEEYEMQQTWLNDDDSEYMSSQFIIHNSFFTKDNFMFSFYGT